MSDSLTITLTDRPPVRIRKADWGIVASATGDSWAGTDYARHQQALGQGEVDRYRLTVRQHADGRAIVYAVVNAAAAAWNQPAWGEDYRGGELLPVGADLGAAIRRVGEDAGLPDRMVRAAIADLPAEEL